MRGGLAVAVSVTLLAASSPRASAQPAGPVPPPPADKPGAPDAKAIARQHFQKAKELHEKKQYAEAAAEYLAAYRNMPLPAFIYNAGQVFRLGGEKQKALDHYKKYLELEPKGEGAEDARQFIAELTAAIEADEKARGAAAEAPGGGAGAGPVAGGGGDPGRDTGEKPGRGLMVAGLVSGGIGVAALGAAAVFALRARSADSDLDGFSGTWTPEKEDRYAAGQRAERNMTVSLVVGVVSLAAGGTMYVIGRRQALRAGARPVLGAAASGDGAFVSLSGAF